jgi:hypothetical protein
LFYNLKKVPISPPLKRLIRTFKTFVKGNFTISRRVYYFIFLARKKICFGHFSTKKRIFHTTVNPGSGTGIPVLRSSSTAIPVLKKSAGIANPTPACILSSEIDSVPILARGVLV